MHICIFRPCPQHLHGSIRHFNLNHPPARSTPQVSAMNSTAWATIVPFHPPFLVHAQAIRPPARSTPQVSAMNSTACATSSRLVFHARALHRRMVNSGLEYCMHLCRHTAFWGLKSWLESPARAVSSWRQCNRRKSPARSAGRASVNRAVREAAHTSSSATAICLTVRFLRLSATSCCHCSAAPVARRGRSRTCTECAGHLRLCSKNGGEQPGRAARLHKQPCTAAVRSNKAHYPCHDQVGNPHLPHLQCSGLLAQHFSRGCRCGAGHRCYLYRGTRWGHGAGTAAGGAAAAATPRAGIRCHTDASHAAAGRQKAAAAPGGVLRPSGGERSSGRGAAGAPVGRGAQADRAGR